MSDSRLQLIGLVVLGVVLSFRAAGPALAVVGAAPIWQVGGPEAGDYLGYSVATAGDVNRDGYSDVIVGAPNYSNGQTYEGAAFLYLGSATGLSTTPAWSYESNQIGGRLGVSVAPAGDVNNDGYADVIIGADTYDIGQTEEGCAFVFLGFPGGLAGSPVWTGQSNQTGAQFGYSVAFAGDVNQDGYDDIIVGAPFYDGSMANGGAAFVYYGASYGVQANYSWAYIPPGTGSNAYYGRSVATAGDVNADGYADVIIGADGFSGPPGNQCGRAKVFLGASSGLSTTECWDGWGFQDNDHYGRCVATAGDVDGDGYSDVVVGAPDADGTSADEGTVYLYRGASYGVESTAARALAVPQASAHFGTSVSTAGDTNGDGFADLIVGARLYDGGQTDEGRVYVYEGSTEGLWTTPVWTDERNQADARYGSSVCAAGDVNGDGFGDVITGTWAWDAPAVNAGGAWVFAGSAEGLSDTPGWGRFGDEVSSRLGTGVCIAGDVNGDGFSDVAIGAPYYDASGMNDVGRAWEFLGYPVVPSSQPNWIGTGESSNDAFGMELAAAGDVNGDGYGDLLVAAPEGDYAGNHWAGKVYLYLGSDHGLEESPVWMQGGDAEYMAFGVDVDGAGDLNGDGYADVIIGSAGYLEAGLQRGKAFVYLGSAAGLATTPAWTREGIPGSLFGASVAGAGDVNGDGYSDAIVGARNTDVPGGEIGQAFVYLGGPNGLPSSPAWSENLGQVGDGFGWSVDGAGDMNGDGYDDVIVGAPSYTQSGFPAEAGAVAIYLGSSTGPATSPSWFTWCDQADAAMGIRVCGAGDVNGDGLSDVAFSAPNLDAGPTSAGCVWVKLGSPTGPTGFVDWVKFGTQSYEFFGAGLDGAGDVNGDGYDDLVVGSPGYPESDASGLVRIYFGNDRNVSYRGFPSIPRQQQPSDWSPIDLLGRSEEMDGFQLAAVGASAAGRVPVRLEWQAAEQGTALPGQWIQHNTWQLPSPPMPDWGCYVAMVAQMIGLPADTPCHWRLRVASRSPYFPWTPWMSTHGTVPSQVQVRTAQDPSGVEEGAVAAGAELRLTAVLPNPFVRQTSLVYELPTVGPVFVTVHDATGRRVRALVDAVKEPGRYAVRWNGKDDRGSFVASGVYFARIAAGGEERTAKIVRRR